MALSRVEGDDELYLGGIWALRRSDSLTERNITHVLSMVGFNTANLKNFKDEPWSEYSKAFRTLLIDVDDVDDEDLLVELPRAVKFVDEGLRGSNPGGVFVHCAAGKSRSATVIVAYLLWRYPSRFAPPEQPRKDTATAAVEAALAHIRRTRPMAEPNPGFMEQLELYWAMGCPDDVEGHHAYQRWAYKREVEMSTAVGQAPTRLRFEDEEQKVPTDASGLTARCKKCRRTLASSPFIIDHKPPSPASPACQHLFVEPLSWMREELEKGTLNGRLLCPNTRCGAGVGRYDWKGFRCSCGAWVTPGLSLQRGRVDEAVAGAGGGIRMPPGRGGNL